MRRILPVLAILSLILSLPGPLTASVFAQADYPISGGHFYTQASPVGAAGFGFRITNEGGIPFFSTYERLGGPSVLGYPISRRFMWQGFIHQATQKAILQWQPNGNSGVVAFTNVFDELGRAGKDGWLLAVRSTPQPLPLNASEVGQSIDAITKARLALLDGRPAMKAKYYAVAQAIDPVLLYGLPTSGIVDMGSHYAIRLQRAVIQEWKQNTPWAGAGEATVANGGDIALEAGIIPPAALVPMMPSIPEGPDLPALSLEGERAASSAKPAVVKVTLPNGDWGSGMIIDPSGLILTNAHVVEDASVAQVQLLDGRRFTGQVRGRDPVADVAIVKIEASDLPSVTLGNSDALQAGETVVAIGYTAAVPRPPSSRIGIVRHLVGDPSLGGGEIYDTIGSDTFIHPGDSGGPLLNLQGEVVGINAAITLGDGGRFIEASSIAINSVRALISRLQ